MTSHFTITPGIDHRLGDWSKYIQTQENVSGPCVTLSREFGCQAYPVAEAIEKRLKKHGRNNWITLDRILMEKIAEDSGFSKDELNKVELSSPIFRSMINMFMGRHGAEHYEVFNYIKKAVRHFAKAGNCTIVGRGGSNMTQDLPNCIHVRLVASMDYRIKNIMEVKSLSNNEAIEHIKREQLKREEFVHHCTGQYPGIVGLYHLIINNERHTPEQMAEIIENEINVQMPESIPR